MMNKKGSTLMNWTFGIMVILLFLVILQSQVFDNMNTIYNKSIDTGLNTSGLDSFSSMTQEAGNATAGGTVSSSSDGFDFLSSWTIGKGIYNTLFSFISGNFISTLLTDILDLPPIIASTLVVMIWISLILIIVYIFMKVVI